MNAFDPALFAVSAPCMPCCDESACSCALLIPPFGEPYADITEALAVLSDPLKVAGCIVYSNDPFADSLTAAFSGTSLDVSATFPSASTSFGDVWASINAKSGATLTLTFTDAENGTIGIYGCDGTEIEILGPSASPIVSSALPEDGEYYIVVALSSPPMTSDFTSCSFSVTSSDTLGINPVIAQYDGLSTTEQLQCLEPHCEYECISENNFFNGVGCGPNAGTDCNTFVIEGAPPPCTTITQTAQVRLVLTDLIPGAAYNATVNFSCVGDGCSGGSFTWCFVAESDTETTAYTDVPAATVDISYGVGSCSVTHVCSCD